MLFLVAVLLSTGAAAMIYEVVLIREFTVVLGSSFYSSAAVLSSVMLGLAVGAYVFGKLSDRVDPVKILFILELAIALLSMVIVPLARKAAVFDWEVSLVLSVLVPLLPATLMGGELPAAIRIASSRMGIGASSGICYSLDTLGGIAGSLLAGFLLIPTLGSLKTVLLAGTLNLFGAASVAHLGNRTFRLNIVRSVAVFAALLCLVGAYSASQLIEFGTQAEIYEGFYIVNITETRYQTIVVAYNDVLGKCLFLDGSLQISDVADEPYSESLVLPALITLLAHKRNLSVLIIGGGDLGVAEVLTRFPEEDVRNVTIVELDAKVVEISKKYLREIHNDCWKDRRLEIVFEDCRRFVRDAMRRGEKFDLVIVDLPDPKDDLSATMYSLEFYNSLYEILSDDGALVTQATAADYALGYKSFAIVAKTLEASKFGIVRPYIKYVPSFGMWGFVMASKRYDPLELNGSEIASLLSGVEVHTYSEDVHFAMFALPPWLRGAIDAAEINTIDRPVLIT